MANIQMIGGFGADPVDPFLINGVTVDWVQWTFFGWLGVSFAVIFSNLGAAYGTAKAGIGIGSIAVTKPELVYKSLVPVVMAGIIAIYGLVVAALIANDIKPEGYTLYK